jgi:hypothetical protein
MEGCRTLMTRCPRLGHEVPFSYCEHEAGALPCSRVIACWQGGFPVEVHLRDTLGAEAWERFLSQEPRDRMTTLLDLVDAAKRRRRGKE